MFVVDGGASDRCVGEDGVELRGEERELVLQIDRGFQDDDQCI